MRIRRRDAKRSDASTASDAHRREPRARVAREIAKRSTHRLRPRRRSIHYIEITGRGEDGCIMQFVKREIAIVWTLPRNVPPRGENPVDADALRNMFEGMPAVVFRVARRVEVVPQRQERFAAQSSGRHARLLRHGTTSTFDAPRLRVSSK